VDHPVLRSRGRDARAPRPSKPGASSSACFVVRAARQTGKTTALHALAKRLVAEGAYAAALVSAEVGQPFSDDVGAAEDAILDAWRWSTAPDLPAELRPPPWPAAPPGQRIRAALGAWAERCPRPLVVFIDEIDALLDHSLLSTLRQLRDGYRARPEHFPHALALVGLRDVRDYRAGDDRRLGGRGERTRPHRR
jgi:hypothetical protein